MITSLRNPRVAAARKLRRTRERRETGRTTIEGPLLLEEAIAGAITIHEVYVLPEDRRGEELSRRAGVEATAVAPHVLEALAESVSPRGPVAVIAVPEPVPLQRVDTIVMWEISDPGNAGTIIRTAGAFGFQVAATNGCVDVWSPKVVRSAVGGHFRANPVTGLATDLGVFEDAGLRPVVATAGKPSDLAEVLGGTQPVGLIVGNEAHGVPEPVIRPGVVDTVSLPMPGGAESLNAAVAAAVLMYLRMSA